MILSSLIDDLMLFLDFFDNRIILHEQMEVSLVIIDNFNLVCPSIHCIDMCFEVVFQVGSVLIEARHGKCISDRIDNSVIFFQFFDSGVVEGSEVQVEDEEDYRVDDVADGHD